jgi:hypothetical protein
MIFTEASCDWPVKGQVARRPIERRTPLSAQNLANSIEVYWHPRSVLNRIRFNRDYVEPCVKPGDGSWPALAGLPD